MIIYDSQQQRIRLGRKIGGGGEAAVYEIVEQSALLAKIYHDRPPRQEYQEKLIWMQSNPPDNPTEAIGHASIAWPKELLYSPDGQLVGYLMPYIRNAVSLLEVFNPRRRAQTLPGFNRQYLHRTAQNLANAVEALHIYGYVVGDLNESNVMVTSRALVTLIDTDSFQIKTQVGDQIQIYPCPVGKPEYTPPELQGKFFEQTYRLPEHDRFGLAVLIFQLLMNGNHPFRAQWMGDGDPPPLEDRIRLGCFPYDVSPPCPVLSPRHAPSLNILHPKLAQLVRECFVKGHHNPKLRPLPITWAKVLAEAEQSLKKCPYGHYYAAHLTNCPQCVQQRGRRQQAALPRPVSQIRPTVVTPQTQPIIATPVTAPIAVQASSAPASRSKPPVVSNLYQWGRVLAIITIILVGAGIIAIVSSVRWDAVVPQPAVAPPATSTSLPARAVPLVITPSPPPTHTPLPSPTNTLVIELVETILPSATDTPVPIPTLTPTLSPPSPTVTPIVETGEPDIFIILPPGDAFIQGEMIRVVVAVQDPDGVGNVFWWVTDEETTEVILRNNYWCNHQIECVFAEEVGDLKAGTFNIFVVAIDSQENSILEEAQILIR